MLHTHAIVNPPEVSVQTGRTRYRGALHYARTRHSELDDNDNDKGVPNVGENFHAAPIAWSPEHRRQELAVR